VQGRLTALEDAAALAAQSFEFIFHIEEGSPPHSGAIESYIIPDVITSMPVISVCACATFALLAQQDCAVATSIRKLSLPAAQQLGSIKVPMIARRMWLNCDATRLAIVDNQVLLLVLCLPV
jgi:hypothetical protein